MKKQLPETQILVSTENATGPAPVVPNLQDIETLF